MSLTRKAEDGYRSGSVSIIGVDEAGRGPLAGPVVTAACFIEDGVHIDGINDSKQTKEEDRDAMYDVLVNHPSVRWAVTVVSHIEIDEVNILQATMNGMRRCTTALVEKLAKTNKNVKFRALVDGNRIPEDMPIDSTYVIKGDSIIFSIAAASIIAKVTRDRLMLELHAEFPVYNFAQHKGYPTFAHRSILMQHGPCRVHRASYAPVKLAMQAHGITSLTEIGAVSAVKATAKAPKKGTVAKGTAPVKAVISSAVTVVETTAVSSTGRKRSARTLEKAAETVTVPKARAKAARAASPRGSDTASEVAAKDKGVKRIRTISMPEQPKTSPVAVKTARHVARKNSRGATQLQSAGAAKVVLEPLTATADGSNGLRRSSRLRK